MTALLIAITAPILAMGAAASVEPTAKPAADAANKEKLICRTQDKIGSRLGGKRVCNTKARWAEIEADSVASVRGFQQERQSNPTNGN